MDGPQGDSMSERHRRAPGKQSSTSPEDAAAIRNGVSSANPPCGACKFLRRKCLSGCIFAPHFGLDQGAARFAAVHKVFGASNVSKLLLHIPANRRHDAVLTICYEAQARLSDPVYGCVSTIVALQQQVTSLQTELSFLQTQLINSRFVMSNALQTSPQLQQQQQQQEHLQHQQMAASLLQPAYSKASSVSENLMGMHSFSTQFAETAPSSSFDHIYSHVSSLTLQDQEEEEEESHDPVLAFANHIFHS